MPRLLLGDRSHSQIIQNDLGFFPYTSDSLMLCFFINSLTKAFASLGIPFYLMDLFKRIAFSRSLFLPLLSKYLANSWIIIELPKYFIRKLSRNLLKTSEAFRLVLCFQYLGHKGLSQWYR